MFFSPQNEIVLPSLRTHLSEVLKKLLLMFWIVCMKKKSDKYIFIFQNYFNIIIMKLQNAEHTECTKEIQQFFKIQRIFLFK